MKGFYIEITNHLLDPKHIKAMGKNSAVWEFMWCLDRITKIDENEIGWVLGGKPINLKELSEELGKVEGSISRNLHKLSKSKYINLKHTPYGIIISVNKAKKRFNRKVKPTLTKKSNLVAESSNLIKTSSDDNNNKTIANVSTKPSIFYAFDIILKHKPEWLSKDDKVLASKTRGIIKQLLDKPFNNEISQLVEFLTLQLTTGRPPDEPSWLVNRAWGWYRQKQAKQADEKLTEKEDSRFLETRIPTGLESLETILERRK